MSHASAPPSTQSGMKESQTALPDLGNPTSTRSWVALTAVLLLIAATGAWSLLGQISVQTRVAAVAAGGGLVYQVTAPTDGTIGELSPVGTVIGKGTPVARIDPLDGGDSVGVATQDDILISAWEVTLGSPVTAGDRIARAVVFGKEPSKAGLDIDEPLAALVYASEEFANSIEKAPELEVSVVGTDGTTYTSPGKYLSRSPFPVTEERVELISGNPVFAESILQSDQGDIFEVYIGYQDQSDLKRNVDARKPGQEPVILSGEGATLIVTEVATNPLAFLFGSGG